jgi:hypothetical protein
MMIRDFSLPTPIFSCLTHETYSEAQALSKSYEMVQESKVTERQGCINLLLQAGCDIFRANNNNQVPYPMAFLTEKKDFLSYWYAVQVEEFKAAQNNLNFAGNAIAVTAALVATASYVGPLQPPLGYGGDSNQLQYGNIWVLLFIVFDTTSFYLAITAITVSLVPSFPVKIKMYILMLCSMDVM